MEHLTDPVSALREMLRVLKPGGVIGVCSPDWGGFVLAPPSDALASAIEAYTTLQVRNGGDVHVGRKLGTHLTAAGFANCQMSARYEVYSSLPLIGEYLALQFDRAGDPASVATLRTWSEQPGGLFAQCWVSCIAYKPGGSRISTQQSLMDQFLRPTDVIDWTHPEVLERARELADGSDDQTVIAKRCYDWVRDEIRHSRDFRLQPWSLFR